MQLTRFTDLSLRVLMYLARQGENASANVPTMALAFSVPENHLVKVVHHLGKIGYVKTTRGRGGGVALARPMAEIRIGEVVRQTEPGLELVDCDAPAPCPFRGGCELKIVLDDAVAVFLARLDAVTLADLAPRTPKRPGMTPLPVATGLT